MPDYIGQQVGNYRLTSSLGKGGFAEVYLGEHIYLRSKAALKFLSTQINSANQARFLAEARFLASLSHPHIIRILDFGIEHGVPFLIMEYAPNGSLRDKHPRGTPLSLDTIIAYVVQVADALQYAHDEKLVHRDIKPENMLLGQHDSVLLSDFGIALPVQSSLTQNLQEVAGTAIYMAPEQLQGKPRPASDQYALGIAIYEWLSGKAPFEGTFTEIASQHLFVPPPPLVGRIPGISTSLERVVLTALAKDAKSRYPNMHAFANALQQISRETGNPVKLVLPYVPPSDSSSNLLTAQLGASPHEPTFDLAPNQPDVVTDIASEPTIAETASMQAQTTSSPYLRPAFSRRAMITGLISLSTIGLVGGGFALLKYVQAQQAPRSGIILPTTTTPGSAPTVNTMFGWNAQHTHFYPDEHAISTTNVVRLKQKWATPIGGIIGASSAAVAYGAIYIGSFDHKLYALDASSGKINWMVTTGDIIYSSPAVVDGVVYVGSVDKEVYAIDAALGTVLWNISTGGGISSSPTVVEGVVYIGSGDSKVYALEASSGNVLWTAQTESAVNSSPAFANGIVYIGSFDHKLYAINASSGAIIWTRQLDGGIFDTPAVEDGTVYVGTQESFTIYAIDAASGTVKWHVKTGDYVNSSPALAYGMVYIGSKDGNLYAIDARNGKVRWKAIAVAGAEIASSPAIANEVVYVGSWDHNFYALDASTGKILWKANTGQGIESSPTIAHGTIFVGSRDRKVYAFSL
ncbi:MAG: PQQ-binding-like beta-propeller repeat protein [Ktedonobacteraceae bacterium]|nr:PQQ-binding-like beta-propeller repeat protein [Ktedonobacteraceae bacterium]